MFLFNALAHNPKAKHIWSYLEAAWISDKDVDNLRNLEHMDARAYEALHNVHGFAELPEPEGLSYVDSFEKYLLKDSIENWVSSTRDLGDIREVKE